MAQRLSQPSTVNVLIGNANWAWPQAVAELFRPRGINALVANSSNEMVNIIDKNKVHLALLDVSFDQLTGLQTLKIIRKHDKLLPCILLAQLINERLLSEALSLDVFSVLNIPVDITRLQEQLNRLFVKYYDSNMFERSTVKNGKDED